MALLLGALLLTGCATLPFRETAPVVMDAVDPRRMLEQYREQLPERFQLLTSVVFAYRWRSFAGIGMVECDRGTGAFRIVCLNPLGVKLFELSGDAQTTEAHFVMPQLMEQGGDFATTVGNDLRRIYFGVVPSAQASVSRKKYALVFREPAGSGTLEYVFAGAGEDLVEKRYYEEGDLVWRVSYYEYREISGKRYPQGIILTNHHHGYRLTVRMKESDS